MEAETRLFFEAVVREDRSILDFIEGDFTYINERLARLYGIQGVEGKEPRRVSLAGTPRRGVLMHAVGAHGDVLAISKAIRHSIRYRAPN